MLDFRNALPNSNGTPSGIDAFGTVPNAPDFSPIPGGVYSARVLRGEYTTTRAGADAYRLRFEVTEGEYKGKTVIRTLTFGAKALSHTQAALAPFGLVNKTQLLSPFPNAGREYHVRLMVALQRGDDGIERNDIKRIDLIRVDESPAAAFLLPEQTEGGPK